MRWATSKYDGSAPNNGFKEVARKDGVMTEQEPWTIKRLLEWTTNYLKQNGAASPRLDAEVLLSNAIGCQRIDLYVSFDQVPPAAQLATFREHVKRRSTGVPVAYLVGQKEFFSLAFKVTPDVLIPRPETEFVVIRALDVVKQQAKSDLQIADVGTGSGVLAIVLAKKLPSAHVTAIDISPAALEVARVNAETHGVADRIDFVVGDVLQDVPPNQKFDLIVSNPPYIALSDSEVQPDVKKHEPHLALFAGPNGDEIITRLIDQAATRLNPGGYLLIETSPKLMSRCIEYCQAHADLCETRSTADLAGLPRVCETKRRSE
jgi:release factor glutamine methyltransferase